MQITFYSFVLVAVEMGLVSYKDHHQSVAVDGRIPHALVIAPLIRRVQTLPLACLPFIHFVGYIVSIKRIECVLSFNPITHNMYITVSLIIKPLY